MSMECSAIAFDEHVIELLKLSALALPCEPAPLCFTILPRAHQQVKWLASLAAIASVERENFPFQRLLDLLVHGNAFARRVGEIGQKHDVHHRIAVRKPVVLQLFDQERHFVLAGDHDRDRYQRRAVLRQPVTKVEFEKSSRRQEARNRPMQESDRDNRSGNERQGQAGEPSRRACVSGVEIHRWQQKGPDKEPDERNEVDRAGMAQGIVQKAGPSREYRSCLLPECPAPITAEPESDVMRSVVRQSGAACLDRLECDIGLG